MKLTAVAISLCLGLTAVTANRLPQFSDIDGDSAVAIVRPFGGWDDLQDVNVSMDRAATGDIDDDDDDDDKKGIQRPGDDPENGAFTIRTAMTQDPSEFDSYVLNVFRTKSKTRCDQFVTDTTKDCKKKLPGVQHCLSEVGRLSATFYNAVKAGGTTSILFSMPVIEIKSPENAPLTKPEQCKGKEYYKVPKQWCYKLYGEKGLNDPVYLNACTKRLRELRTDCLNAVENSPEKRYPFFFPVFYQRGK
ncbi:hypothetical protein HDU96_003201 [Phlyctochytrium bullatum]|nr:hypothetical protein HDU96_003201 [Phlyctochytrium bullatum]